MISIRFSTRYTDLIVLDSCVILIGRVSSVMRMIKLHEAQEQVN